MKGFVSCIFSRRLLFSSIAGLSVVCTTLYSIKSPKTGSSKQQCQKPAFMSTAVRTPPKLGLFMVDFDNTCNMRDTCELFYKTSQKYQFASEQERTVLDKRWREVTEKYMKDYTSIVAETLDTFPNTSLNNFDEKGLESFLEVVAKFNVAATEDVEKSKLMTGIDSIGLQWAAKQVILYPGCLDVLKAVLSHVRVVSVNWSAVFIGYSLNNIIPEEHIFANHLLDKNGLSNGKVGKEMISSFDKKKVMQMLIDETDLHGLTVFVGDSITDLLCLVQADVGVIIGESKAVLKTASKFGVGVIPLSEALQNNLFDEKKAKNCGNALTLYKANNWSEIAELARKLQ